MVRDLAHLVAARAIVEARISGAEDAAEIIDRVGDADVNGFWALFGGFSVDCVVVLLNCLRPHLVALRRMLSAELDERRAKRELSASDQQQQYYREIVKASTALGIVDQMLLRCEMAEGLT